MSEHMLSYQPVTHRGPSRWATWSLWLASAGIVLFLIALGDFQFLAKPAYSAATKPPFSAATFAQYRMYKTYLSVIPAWTAMGMVLIASCFAIVGMLRGRASRKRSAIVLALCLLFLVLLATSG